jgi:hypothetical protein
MPLLTFAHYHNGLPGYWRDEKSGLPAEVEAFISHRAAQGPEPSPDQLRRLCSYIQYFVNAPRWEENCSQDEGMLAELHQLKARAQTLASAESIHRWLEEAMDLGLDPI